MEALHHQHFYLHYQYFYFQRIADHTRCGGPTKLHYVEALQDPTSGLTLPVLTGARKPSVIDAERLFNPDLAKFMHSKGYTLEAKCIEVIWNWRRACDHRGLTELQCCHYNYNFLNLVLNKLMPWHREIDDFQFLEVNRYAFITPNIVSTFSLSSDRLTTFSDFQEKLL